MKAILRAAGWIVDSPYVTLASGIILIASAIFQMMDTGLERALGVDIGTHHGVLLFGILQACRALVDMGDGGGRLKQGLKHSMRREQA